jgi:adenylate cyclase
MGREIERRFLVRDGGFREGARVSHIEQGFLSTDPERVVRVRIEQGEATLTIKGRGEGASRPEYEYPIPVREARELIDALCVRPPIAKTRYRVAYQGALFEVDVFEGANEGLVLAEVELPSEDAAFARPAWLGEEVTADPRYANAYLAEHPYRSWTPSSSRAGGA